MSQHVTKRKYKIMNTCIGCRNCYRVCPEGAIFCGPMRINQNLCISCGECYRRCPSHKIIEYDGEE